MKVSHGWDCKLLKTNFQLILQYFCYIPSISYFLDSSETQFPRSNVLYLGVVYFVFI